MYVWCVDGTGKSRLVRMAKGRNGEMARRKGNGRRGGEGDFIPGERLHRVRESGLMEVLWDPGFPKFGERSGERAGLVHRECAGRGVSAPKWVLALGQHGGYA